MLHMFGFGRKSKPLITPLTPPPPARDFRVKPSPPSVPSPPAKRVRLICSPSGTHSFTVKTRIAKAVGKNGRYACGSVRALPSVHKNEVLLQATDGHQATCVLTQGQMSSSRLIPAGVLPTRQASKPVGVQLMGGRWESSEGATVEDATGDDSFPSLGDVLPQVGKYPFYETAVQADRRRTTDPALSMYLMLGIDIDLLRKAADALGTSKLTLLVPVPVKDVNQKPGEVFVNKPVAICPAIRDSETQGVSVVMPLTPEHGASYYTKMREMIAASEKANAKRQPPVPVPVPMMARPQARQAG